MKRGALACPLRRGLLAEFASAEELSGAVSRLVTGGYRRLDTFTPYPVEEAIEAMGLPRSRIPLFVLLAGVSGIVIAYLIQWWTNAVDYPLVIGGMPLNSVPSHVPIMFETCVLLGGLTAFAALLFFTRLPALWHPVFEVEGFERASIDRFFLGVDAADAAFDSARTTEELRQAGALRVVVIGRGLEERQ
jgi:hypothetical protein